MLRHVGKASGLRCAQDPRFLCITGVRMVFMRANTYTH